MNEEIIQEKLDSMKKNTMKIIKGEKLNIGMKIPARGSETGFKTEEFYFLKAKISCVESDDVVFDEENGTKFFVLYKDMELNIGKEGIDITVQNAVID